MENKIKNLIENELKPYNTVFVFEASRYWHSQNNDKLDKIKRFMT